MKTIPLKCINKNISHLGFGGLPIQRISSSAATRLIKYALDIGINYFDTAESYGDSEVKIGKAIQNAERDSIIISSRSLQRTRELFKRALENSLKKIKTSYIDIYQIHFIKNANDFYNLLKPNGIYDYLQYEKEKGEIKSIGASVHSLDVCKLVLDSKLFDVIQCPTNYISTEFIDYVYPYAINGTINVVGMKPFLGGTIQNYALAIKFLKQYEEIVICAGYENEIQLQEAFVNYMSTEILTESDNKEITNFRQSLSKCYCYRCEYCLPCPQGIRIPLILSYESFIKRFGNDMAEEIEYEMERVKTCINCKICSTKCPYGLPISKLLQEKYTKYKNN